ncbi:MAG TPA: branched-chain amino acid ABC transporter permease [Candidatus Cybelea sp.]|nr:branched-chain amino acid ABC transporter permease [Candidatus Cybelea sp.]
MQSFGVFAETFLQALTAGLLVGAIYGLMCVGLGLIFGVMRVINFAQGDFLMLGMYVTLYLVAGIALLPFQSSTAVPFVAAIVAGPILCAAGYLLHRALISRVTGTRAAGVEGEGHYAQLILTLGLSLIVQNGGLILFGSTPQSVRTALSSRAWEIPLRFNDTAALFLNQARTIAALVSIVVAVALYWIINRSRLGKMLRAAADNSMAATYMGIDVDRAHRIAFGIGIGVTAVAGGLVATFNPFQPYVGLDYVIIMYAGVVLGGMGSILGAYWGGMTIGLVQQLSTLVLPTQLQNATIFVVFLLIVLIRPQGLFGRASERV